MFLTCVYRKEESNAQQLPHPSSQEKSVVVVVVVVIIVDLLFVYFYFLNTSGLEKHYF
jgi:hypothetical protein